MSILLQHILVLVVVTSAVAYVAWHAVRGLTGKSSRVGSCCARGCGQSANPTPRSTERVVFLPLETLTRKR
jgi:hypothetical protein